MDLRSLNELFDDIMICALLMNDKSGYAEFTDCIPEALNSIYKLSLILGVKIRYSTINMILNYVRGLDEIEELDVEELIILLRELVNNRDIENLSKVSLQKILKIAIGKEINIGVHSKDALELLLTIFYAMFLSTLNDFRKDAIQLQETLIISMPQTLIETITV